MQKITVFLVALATICLCDAKFFETECDLVHELRRQGFPEDKMRKWVCLINNESARTTDIVGKNTDRSQDYGLFQINDKYWCSKTSTPGKNCNVTCAQMLLDDITLASTCAKKIYERQSWFGWRRHRTACIGKPLPDISKC